ncbi:amino acid transporter [Echria macrotheca]|uniref:Amino acid transporter n=1 Tax=Echria macrotheca TaxID=438768 RepID=A0AAJ0F744_9PEZI|nr:amino acid transporter [Echria macrotheca]
MADLPGMQVAAPAAAAPPAAPPAGSLHSASGTADDEEYDSTSLEAWQQRLANLQANRRVLDFAPTTRQRIGAFSVVCLVMNRTIGTGIFAQPVVVLRYAGSSGVAIVLWIAAGLIVYCITLCWLELGLSVPTYMVRSQNTQGQDNNAGEKVRVSAPRSGGDKNYLEYIYRRPPMLITCIFGITFLIFGNLAGNSIQFGMYVEMARNPECLEDSCRNKGAVIGWAILVLTFCSLFNVATRRYSILLNNIFAVAKMAFVVFIVFAGIGWSRANGNACREIDWTTRGSGGSFGDIILALVYAMYPYGGYEQPFYVLAEIKHPRTTFPKAANLAMILLIIFYPLANVSYLCMVPYTDDAALPPNMAIAFFQKMNEQIATRLVSIILLVFIIGNINAQTFTASRVKQEVAKEGILGLLGIPVSLFFARGAPTWLSYLRPKDSTDIGRRLRSHREQTPVAATFLHLGITIVLVLAFGLSLPPSRSYALLTFLQTFTIVILLGCLTVCGLLYLKIDSWLARPGNRGWLSRKGQDDGVRRWRPYFDPMPNIVAAASLVFIVAAVFVPTRAKSATLTEDDGSTTLPYWAGPLAGWLAAIIGIGWWSALQIAQKRGRWTLVVTRDPHLDQVDGNYVQTAETVVHRKVYEQAPDLEGHDVADLGGHQVAHPHEVAHPGTHEAADQEGHV